MQLKCHPSILPTPTMISQQHFLASVIDSFPKMEQATGPGEGGGGAQQMLTTVSIGPERSPVLRENTGPVSPPQTLRVCYVGIVQSLSRV